MGIKEIKIVGDPRASLIPDFERSYEYIELSKTVRRVNDDVFRKQENFISR
jgi:hypothetical protein